MQICIPALALLSALFSALAALLVLADRFCVASGGQGSDNAWTCTLPATSGGEVVSLWSLIDLPMAAIAVLLVGVPVYTVIRLIGRRWNRCAAPGVPPAK